MVRLLCGVVSWRALGPDASCSTPTSLPCVDKALNTRVAEGPGDTCCSFYKAQLTFMPRRRYQILQAAPAISVPEVERFFAEKNPTANLWFGAFVAAVFLKQSVSVGKFSVRFSPVSFYFECALDILKAFVQCLSDVSLMFCDI